MFYKKSYSYGKLGNKGTNNISTKLFGGMKNAGIDFAQGYYANHVLPQVEKKIVNYLEKK